ncbi:MAG TPA: hydantoinase B/oxoprolinase family protein [Acidimicrobiales bacterium]|nr:hydantoinase B/oxoprolinase family protein [Acidimicrobiales bacterium]
MREPAPAEGRGEDEFGIRRQLLTNQLAAIADEMALTVFRTAYSTVVRDGMDFSTALCRSDGETIAQAVTVPFHLGSIPVAMQSLFRRYGDAFAPGDVYLMNDPFDGGIHLPDLFVVKPVFAEGELIGFAVATAHHGDVGGRVAGSSSCDNREIFEEGLRIPWVRFYERGEPVDELFRLVEANVRVPAMTLGDLHAQIAACNTGEAGLLGLAGEYGVSRLARTTTQLVDYTERLVRQEIESWPDGTASFTDYLDSDGIEPRDVPISVTISIDGSEITADFSDSSPMVAGALNSTRSFVAAAVYHAVHALMSEEVPATSGAFRPVRVVTRPGTIVDVVMPGASSMRGVTGFRAFDAVMGALAQLLPGRVPAAGEGGNTLCILAGGQGERRFVYYELFCGTWGATPAGDGNDGLSNPSSTAANIPVEVAEEDFPIRIEHYGYVPDTGGAGEYRGGLSLSRSWRCLEDGMTLTVRSDRQRHAPYGVSGGGAGAPSLSVIRRVGGDETVMPPMFRCEMSAGDLFTHRIAGGGGYGRASDRSSRRIESDLRTGKLSGQHVREVYGVAVGDGDPPG